MVWGFWGARFQETKTEHAVKLMLNSQGAGCFIRVMKVEWSVLQMFSDEWWRTRVGLLAGSRSRVRCAIS